MTLYAIFGCACAVLAALAVHWVGVLIGGYPWWTFPIYPVIGWVVGSAGARIWRWSQR